MTSLPTINQDILDIYHCLSEWKINPKIIPRIIRAVAKLAYGTGYGRVQIFMENRKISAIKPEESDVINEPAIKN